MKFWDRAIAYIIDGIIIGGITIVINVFNITNYKSFLLYLPIAVIAILYKPLMESRFGATFGKMAIGLRVTDRNFNRIGFSQSFLRQYSVKL